MAQTNDAIAAAALAGRPAGLSDDEALARRRAGQGNVAPPPTGRSYRQIIVENVFTFINICLFCLGLALAILGRPADALVSTGVISLNVIVSVVQEIRAKRMLDQIALLTRPTATVRRAGQDREVSPAELVVGDLIRVGPGDQIVVDGRVTGDGRFNVDESQLTGESDLVGKQAGDPVFSGSFCVSGGGWYVAERVGSQSFTNQITAGARTFRRILTPLQSEVHLVIRIMLLIVVYLQFLLVVNDLLKQIELADAVQNASVIAGLVPNGLFVSISVAYALAAVRIVRFGALVQQANAVESLSNVDVLCLDKTGTLTANRLNLAGLHPLKLPEADLRRVIGAVCASAATGNKTSEAIGAACPGPKCRVIAEVPFSSARKWSAVALDEPEGPDGPALRGVFALGAPEMLRPYLDPEDWPAIAAQAAALADQGLRVLLLAHGPDPLALHDEDDASRLPAGLWPLGLVSLTDELRPDARETLAAFVEAGVRPKIISGDNPETVAALAKQAGLGPDIRLLSGIEIDALDDGQLAAAAEEATIFGRITPQQKERLVRVLRGSGHYVAMIGDGVNDVLSLKQANLGIAMQSGSQATRGVADIVLMRDSFAALAPAVIEGQRILNGMEDILRLFLTRIGTIGLLILSALVVGEFPIALRHGSLVTLFSVGIPTVLLAIWSRPGPTPKGRMLQRLVHFVLTPTLLTSAIGLILFYGTLLLLYEQASGGIDDLPVAEYERLMSTIRPLAQTVLASFLVFVGLLLVIFVEPPTPWWVAGEPLSGDRRPALLAAGLMIFFVIMHLVPALRDAFALSPIGPQEVTLVAFATIVWLLLVRLMWRRRLLERFVGVDLGGSTSSN